MRNTISWLLIFFVNLLSAQILTISEEIPMRSDTDYHLVGKTGYKTILFEDRTTKHLVSAFDKRMEKSWEKELELRGRNVKVIDIISHPMGFRLLYSFRQKGRNYLQIDAYDPAANLRDSVTIDEIGDFLHLPNFELQLSQDQSKALLTLQETQQKFSCLAIDLNTLELLYHQKIDPERFYFNENYLQSCITNKGDAFVFIERDNFNSKRKDHRFEVHTIVASSKSAATFDIVMGDSLTYDILFKYDNLNEQLVGGGLYSTKDLVKTKGFFLFTSKQFQAANYQLTFNQFPHQLVENLEGKRLKEKKNKGLNEISIRDIVLRQDGGILLITEKNKQLEQHNTSSQMQAVNAFSNRALVDFYYDEIVVFNINKDGSTPWSSILHKKQYSQDDNGNYSSYMMLEHTQKLRFLFNDEIRLENTVSEYTLDGYGDFDRNSLFHTRDLELKLRFRDGVQVSANELIIPSEVRNKLRLVSITY